MRAGLKISLILSAATFPSHGKGLMRKCQPFKMTLAALYGFHSFYLLFINSGYWFAEVALYPTFLNWRLKQKECLMVHQLLLHFAFPQRLLCRLNRMSKVLVYLIISWLFKYLLCEFFLFLLGGIFNSNTAFRCSC